MSVDYSPKIITNGLLLALDAGNTKSYPGSGTTWTDLIGSNNGTLVNSPTFNSANGGSLNFSGTNQSVTLGSSTSFAFGTGDFSIGAWINSADDQGSFSSIVCLIDGNGGSDWQFDVTNNRPRIYVNGDVLMTTPTEDVLANDVWYHLFWTRIGSTNSLYINGNQVVTATNSENYDSGELHIGRNRSGTGLFNGLISTVSIYKGKGLTASEIAQNYNAIKGRYA